MPSALIVHAHPEPKSFVSGMKEVAREALEESGFDVSVSDLYAEGFDPVAKADDFALRLDRDHLSYAREQRHAFKNGTLAPDVKREFDRLISADLVVFTFPLFWFSTPAILKGWFDRVLLPGPIYSGRRIYENGGLAGKRALVGCTLGGRAHMFGPRAVHGELDTMLRHVLRGTLGYTGMSVLPPYFAYHIPYLPDCDRRELMDAWRRCLKQINTLEPLPMPDLDTFDEIMRPSGSMDARVTSDG